MIPITERVGRSPFYERPAHATKREAENERKAKICLSCTREKCTGTCELMKRRYGTHMVSINGVWVAVPINDTNFEVKYDE